MQLTVNGQARAVEGPVSLAEYLERLGLHARMVVVERNREIVPREQYADVRLEDGDEIEIVQMMAGG